MAGSPDPIAVAVLEEWQLFRFTPGARELASQLDSLDSGPSGSAALLTNLIHLSAAEFALTDVALDGIQVVPASEPHPVDARHMRLAMLKTDCSIDFNCGPSRPPSRSLDLTPAELTVFSADALKLPASDWRSDSIRDEAPFTFIESLRQRHRDSPMEEARRFEEQGGVQLQGLIWYLKTSLASQDDIRDRMREYARRFDLAEPLNM